MGKQRKHPPDNDRLSAIEQQLRAANQQLRASEQQVRAANQQLEASNQQLRAGEEELRKVNHDLSERVKELDCLYGLSRLVERPDIVLDEIFQGLLELIPPAWQYPEITCARVLFEGEHFKTPNFKETKWRQLADIELLGKRAGALEVYYLKKRPELDEGPFLREERNLLNALAERLGHIVERKRAEEALRESRDYLVRLTNSMWDAVFSVKMPGRVIEWVNDSFRLTGYEPEDCIDKTTEFLYPDKKEFIDFGNKLKKSIKAGEDVLHTEQLLRRKNGETFPAEITTTLFKEKGQITRVTSIVRDITERKKVEDRLRFYAAIMANMSEGVYAIRAADGVIVHNNPKFEQMFCYGPGELAGKHVSIVNAPTEKSPQETAEQIIEVLNQEGTWRGEILNIKKDGTPFWCYASVSTFEHPEHGKVWVTMHTDITERKCAEEELQAAYEQLQASEQQFKAANQQLRASEQQLKAANQQLQASEQQLKAANQQLEATNQQLRASEQQLRAANQQLQASEQQLKSLASQLTLTEEHERRRIATDLHSTIGQSLSSCKLMLDVKRASKLPEDLARTLDETCNLLEQAIDQTRTLTFDLSSPTLHELGLEKAIAEWLTERIQKKHRIVTEFEDDGQPKHLSADIRSTLFRDVRELLINVVKHSQATKVKVLIRRVGKKILVSVEDDGWGFDPEQVAAKAVSTGAFGLFSIRERLEQLGGHIEIKSAPGHGCKVTMMAPIKQSKNKE